MNETSAREVVLVQAIESADAARSLWSDADRIAAGQAAARELGEEAALDAWIARRASLALERLSRRTPALGAIAGARLPWPALIAVTLTIAFVAGLGTARIGPSQRINLLAPPLAALLVWNFAVYLLLGWMVIRSWTCPHRDPSHRHLPPRYPSHRLRKRVVQLATTFAGGWRRTIRTGPLAAPAAAFAIEWTRLGIPLGERRAASLLHSGAALLAVGAIAGLYLRGLALEYRAVWQSTFLDATQVAAVLRVALAPGAWITGLAVPGASELARLGPASAGENAARWIHLYAGTLLVVVIAPRLVLAALAWSGAARASRRFPLDLGTPYFRRLARPWRAGTVRGRVLTYSFDVPARQRASIEAVLARVFEAPVELTWAEPARYGDDAPDRVAIGGKASGGNASARSGPGPGVDRSGATESADPATLTVVLFNLSATPEAENHVAFASALAAGEAAATRPIVIVDTSEFAARFHAQADRVAERERAWRNAFEGTAIAPVFMRLAAPDLAADSASVTAALGEGP